MKITEVSLTLFDRDLPGSDHDFAMNSAGRPSSLRPLVSDSCLITITTDEGHSGHAITLKGGTGLGHYIAGTIRPYLIGRDPVMREQLMAELRRMNRLWVLPQFAIGTVDVALWDLYGKALGEPVYRLLGGAHERLPVYASSMTKDTIEEYAEDAVRYKEAGYPAYKIHVPGEPRRDVEVCRAVREAVGDGYVLMVDCVAAYNFTEALWVGRHLEELDYYWFEEPLPDSDIYGYQKLTDALDMSVAGVEVIPGGLSTVQQYITQRAVDIVRADVSYKGGVNETRKIAAVAEAFGMNLEIHTNSNPLLDAATLHVACSIPNTEYYEQLVPEGQFDSPVLNPPRMDSDGYVTMTNEPGFGIELDWDRIKSKTAAVL
jgi:L-alanine-DL-glutamate epimerase-like enolase superfamily enzyme